MKNEQKRSTKIECSALSHGECKNQFPVNGACYGFSGTPICLRENVCGRIYPRTGWGITERRAILRMMGKV